MKKTITIATVLIIIISLFSLTVSAANSSDGTNTTTTQPNIFIEGITFKNTEQTNVVGWYFDLTTRMLIAEYYNASGETYTEIVNEEAWMEYATDVEYRTPTQKVWLFNAQGIAEGITAQNTELYFNDITYKVDYEYMDCNMTLTYNGQLNAVDIYIYGRTVWYNEETTSGGGGTMSQNDGVMMLAGPGGEIQGWETNELLGATINGSATIDGSKVNINVNHILETIMLKDGYIEDLKIVVEPHFSSPEYRVTKIEYTSFIDENAPTISDILSGEPNRTPEAPNGLFMWMLEPLTAFFNLSIDGYLTIGVIITSIIGIGVFIAFLKYFAGG